MPEPTSGTLLVYTVIQPLDVATGASHEEIAEQITTAMTAELGLKFPMNTIAYGYGETIKETHTAVTPVEYIRLGHQARPDTWEALGRHLETHRTRETSIES